MKVQVVYVKQEQPIGVQTGFYQDNGEFEMETCNHADYDEVDAPQIDWESGELWEETFKICNTCGKYEDSDGIWND